MYANSFCNEIQLQPAELTSEKKTYRSQLEKILRRNCYVGENQATSNPSVGQQFWPILSLLQLFGCSPVQVHSSTSRQGGKHCCFRFFSAKSALPFCSAVYFTFLWVKYMIELGFKQPFFGNSLKISKEYFTNFTSHPRNERCMLTSPLMMDSVGTFILFVIPLERIVEIFFSWVGASKLATFLNSWDDLELKYQEICFQDDMDDNVAPSQAEPLIKLIKWRNTFLSCYALLPGVVVFPFYFYANLKEYHRLNILDVLINFSISLHFVFCCLLENASCVFMYKLVSEAFRKVNIQVATLVHSKRMNPRTLYTWRSFIESLRGQCRIIGKLQMQPQLFKLSATLIIITVMIFIVVNGDHRNPNSVGVTLVSLGYALDLLVQLYTKTSIADQVTQNEKRIAEVMASVPTHSIDDETYREVKFIHDMILMNPAKISLGNYVDLNKKLLLVVRLQTLLISGLYDFN